MTWQNPETLPWKSKLTDAEYYDFDPTNAALIIQTQERIGEAVPYYTMDWDTEEYVLKARWANDSCDCCWRSIQDPIQFWQPLPERQNP